MKISSYNAKKKSHEKEYGDESYTKLLIFNDTQNPAEINALFNRLFQRGYSLSLSDLDVANFLKEEISNLNLAITNNNERNKISAMEVYANQVVMELEKDHGNIFAEDDIKFVLVGIKNPDNVISCLNREVQVMITTKRKTDSTMQSMSTYPYLLNSSISFTKDKAKAYLDYFLLFNQSQYPVIQPFEVPLGVMTSQICVRPEDQSS